MKSGLYWRPQGLEGPRVMYYLPRRAAHSEENHLKGGNCVSVSKAGRVEPSEPFEIEHRVIGLGVCLIPLWSCFDPTFPQYALVPPF